MPRAVFLDRDGVLNPLVYRADERVWDSPYTLEEFQIFPDAPAAVKDLKAHGFLVIVISNQPGAAKGKCDGPFLDTLDRRLRGTLSDFGAPLDGAYYCLHHPNAIVTELRISCDCRKPQPGLLLRASHDLSVDLSRSYLIGDRLTDIAAGRAVGCATVLVSHPGDSGSPTTPEDPMDMPEFVAKDLRDAVHVILAQEASEPHGNIHR